MQIDWRKINNFNPKEFPGNTEHAKPKLLYSLDTLRTLLDEKIYPSPVKGALARFGGSKSSRHYVGEGKRSMIRKSDGVDVFIEGIAIRNYELIKDSGLFKGIGIYLDTIGPDGKPWVMFHLDLRESLFYWFAVSQLDPKKKGWKYCYPSNDDQYWRMFRDAKLYKERYFTKDHSND